MTYGVPLFVVKRRLMKSVFILDSTGATWRFREDPYIGKWSLRSGCIYRHADGSVTVWESRLQTWVIRPRQSTAYFRRMRVSAKADQAPSSTLEESI
jgi:hypothetical protein